MPPPRQPRAGTLVTGVVALALTACSSPVTPPSPSSADRATPAGTAGTPGASSQSGPATWPPSWETDLPDMPINLELSADCGLCDQKTGFHWELPRFRLYADGLVVFRETGADRSLTPYRWAQLSDTAREALIAAALDQGGMRTAKPTYRGDTDDAGGYTLWLSPYIEGAANHVVRVEPFLGAGSDPDGPIRARLLAFADVLNSFGAWLDEHGVATERLAPRAFAAALFPNDGAAAGWPWSDLEVADFGETEGLPLARLTPDQARVVAGEALGGEALGGVDVALRAPNGTGYDVLIRPVLPGEDVPGAYGLRPDTAAIAVAGNLRVRSRPEVSDESVKLEPLLTMGQGMYVIAGPVEGSGYRWYHVYVKSPGLVGWIASASKEGEPWIASARLACTLGASPQEIVNQVGYELMHVACFKGQEFTTERHIDGTPMDARERDDYCRKPASVPVAPSWLNDLAGCAFGLRRLGGADTGSYDLFVGSVFHPNVRDTVGALIARSATAGKAVRVRVSGHLDDPATRACTSRTEPPELAALRCRRIFVITDVVPLE